MINVVNKHAVKDHVYCGRGTPLGNPFPMYNEGQRDEVCDKYHEWFYENVDTANLLDIYLGNDNSIPISPQTQQTLSLFEKALKEDINLGCFCAPKRCHCDTIKTFLDETLYKWSCVRNEV